MSKDPKKTQEKAPMTTNQPKAPPHPYGLDPASVAAQIWAKIENLPFPMFSLPGKTVSDYCKPVPIDPSRLFLTYTVGSVIPMLEDVLCTLDQPRGTTPENYSYIKPESRSYKVETTDKYLIVSVNPKY